jgi:hypothetical protein
MNRKERRKATRMPLARLGVPIHSGIARVVLDTPDGPRLVFYWFAGEDLNETIEEIVARKGLHGPFDTEAEANADAKIAIVGEDCEVKKSGTWDPAWSKPQ